MKSALIDTNLLLLLVVGMTNKSYIKIHKRTKTFTVEDYEQLLSDLDHFKPVWVTSHCLAEVSNLLKQIDTKKAEKL